MPPRPEPGPAGGRVATLLGTEEAILYRNAASRRASGAVRYRYAVSENADFRAQAEAIYRAESRRVFATLIRLLGDFDLAEEALHDAFRAALEQWPRDGVPAQSARLARVHRALQGDRPHPPAARASTSLDDVAELVEAIADDAACAGRRGHRGRPAAADLHLLPPRARARRAGRAHAARGVRPHDRGDRARLPDAAADAGAAHRARQGEDPRRAHPLRGARARRAAGAARRACCASIYLVFNEGYSASSGDVADARRPLGRGDPARAGCSCELLPEPEAIGLLALMLLHESRRAARTSPTASSSCSTTRTARSGTARRSPKGRRWSSARSRSRRFGPYTLQAAIAAVHAEARRRADATDWGEIVGLYDVLLRVDAVAGRRAEPRGGGRDARRPGGGPRADRRDRSRAASSTTTTSRTRRAPTCAAGSADRRPRAPRTRARCAGPAGAGAPLPGAPARRAAALSARSLSSIRRHVPFDSR